MAILKKVMIIPFHPVLIALFPLVNFLAYNKAQISVSEVTRTLIVLLASSVFIFGITNLLLKNLQKAAVISTLIFLIFFYTKHGYNLIMNNQGGLIGKGVGVVIIVSYVILCLGILLILRHTKLVATLNSLLTRVSIIALIFPTVVLGVTTLNNEEFTLSDNFSTGLAPLVSNPEISPDIYYIILDGYGNDQLLKNYYGYDNAHFINYLKQKGFILAENSHANYNQTALSISSSLNYQYVNELSDQVSDKYDERQPLSQLIRDSNVRETLAEQGYQIISISDGISMSDIRDADVFLDTSLWINGFEFGFLSTTLADFWLDQYYPDWYRRAKLDVFSNIANIPEQASPKFVFSHILMPHPPFAFGPNGEERPIPDKGFSDGDSFQGTIEDYLQGYTGQMTYLNTIMEETVSAILEKSRTAPIIVIQGDHGPGAHWKSDQDTHICYQERMSILNAYYLPGEGTADQVYPTITPVNTFRVIFNAYFDTNYELLEDRVYFSKWNTPYVFRDITESADQCNLPRVDLNYGP
ncbi:MAG: hypothetical protein NC238_13960 [Dehalobacter sp.]|nr:hypothetical protein [Dehalobacter sp.]